MQIYLINLDRRADRLKNMQAVFEMLGMFFIRVPAVDGMQFAQSLPEWPYSLTPGEVRCFLSHKKCFELIATGEDEYGVVLEDDAELSGSIERYLSTSHWIPENADVIKIETCNSRVQLNRIVSVPRTNMRLGRLLSSHLGAAGYIVSKRAAKLILPLLDETKEPIDDFLFTPGRGILDNMIVYQTIPALCRQSGDVSTINTDRAVWLTERKRIKKRTEEKSKIVFVIIRELIRPFKRLRGYINFKLRKIREYININQYWLRVPFE